MRSTGIKKQYTGYTNVILLSHLFSTITECVRRNYVIATITDIKHKVNTKECVT